MNRRSSFRSFYGWLLVSPFVLTLLVFFVFALLRAAYFSFTDYNLFDEPNWTGLRNFTTIVGDRLFLIAVFNTVSFAIIVTTLQTVLALLLATAVGGHFFGKNFFRVAFYIPAILSSASVTLVFIWFYQKHGFLNEIVSVLLSNGLLIGTVAGLTVLFAVLWLAVSFARGVRTRFFDPVVLLYSTGLALTVTVVAFRAGLIASADVEVSVNWLGTQEYFGPLPRTMWAIVIQNIYTTVPTFMLLFLAGIQGISKDLYEAARVDGAGRWRQFRHITVPQLAPVIFVVVTFGIIGTLQIFDQVALLGDTVPLESRITLAYYVYHSVFPPGAEPHVGIASAAALVLAAITFAIVYLQKMVGVREKADV